MRSAEEGVGRAAEGGVAPAVAAQALQTQVQLEQLKKTVKEENRHRCKLSK